MKYRFLFILIIFTCIPLIRAQEDEEELIGGVQMDTGNSAEGYVLFSPVGLTGTYLINKNGEVINAWDSDYAPASAMYLLDNGNLVRAGRLGRDEGDGGERVIEEFDWDGNVVWQYTYDDPRFTQHHDIEPLPNGNILVIMWEHFPIEEAIQLGFNLDILETIPDIDLEEPLDEIRLDSIIEIDRETNEIVWEWHGRDHLVQDTSDDYPNYGMIADFPRRFNLNYHDVPDAGDLTHFNSIDYNAASDLIIVSARSFSEVWVIDHNITTEEARGEAGDLLYRWGNLEAYGHGTLDDRVLYFQHDARWVDDTQADSALSVFSNGGRKYDILQSQVIEFMVPSDFMMDSTFVEPDIVWQSEGDFFAGIMSGGQRLLNNHVLITLATDGQFVEITDDHDIVWDYINPVYRAVDNGANNRVFRAEFYPTNFVGFNGKILQPQGQLRIGVRD